MRGMSGLRRAWRYTEMKVPSMADLLLKIYTLVISTAVA